MSQIVVQCVKTDMHFWYVGLYLSQEKKVFRFVQYSRKNVLEEIIELLIIKKGEKESARMLRLGQEASRLVELFENDMA